ncbi:hypothetical protein Lepto7376_1401 [[Leptolyngbya] sp. PCC 7376]|uniref:DUF1796 family putative cysteine peptidase n=1 Tax=[Leptolyngbya] sp. PCC 7376 TaxID=111781 RepID=UPI00029F339D|nr:DUF1796 family putative cysteine peptidase [[Leptolyngbya] sp. PCC 7376]AFY37750.1 hypothetical protein Lepto7376_1401 [[Leptolyngbya] sp. PCC 7376]
MKKHIYISLGAACDAAQNLNFLGLRHCSYPFDWLWNLDLGLTAVTQIIEQDFEKITFQDCYIELPHYRFPDPMVVYKAYPTIAHLHTNPLEDSDAHQTLCRRIERFQKELNSDTIKHFIYYRNFNNDLFDQHATLEDTLKKLLNEGEIFIEMLQKKYPEAAKRASLLLVLQTRPLDQNQAQKLTSHYRQKIRKKARFDKIILACSLNRNDNEIALKEQWKRQWETLLFTQTRMPLGMIFQYRFKLFMMRSRIFLGGIKQKITR